MAANLTTQVRGIAKVVTAVANGDLKRKLVLETKGEIAELADTINGMIDTLAIFADQVTNVAREVGIEGKLGGQARVPGAAGIWRDLTDNVNQLAANLTTQVRAIAEVATAVTKGDLTRSIAVEAQGEVAALKDNINEMIMQPQGNHAQEHRAGLAQDQHGAVHRHGAGPARPAHRLQAAALRTDAAGQRAARHLLHQRRAAGRSAVMKLLASYAYRERRDGRRRTSRSGEGLVGQCALEKERILLTDVPSDYIKINSGLGEATPLSIVVLPVLFEGEVKAVIELASFQQLQRHPPGLSRSAHRIASASCSTPSPPPCGPRSC